MQINNQDHSLVKRWLLLCLFLIFVMVILGGVTRLTDSGLSMVDWHPIHGVLPPIGQTAWLEEFANYKQFPEYQKLNRGMSLDAFKSIFWFEYSHRMLGRLIGLVFFFPLVFFWVTRQIPQGMTPRLIVMFCLGGLQGLLGWYMVKSGLVNNPHVSQYRLTAHLMAAILIFGFILWTILDIRKVNVTAKNTANLSPHWRHFSFILFVMVVLTLISGGFVAGLDAGLIYNTFPLMGGKLIPEGIGALSPWYLNPFENRVTVQFDHRLLATVTGTALIVWYIKGRRYFSVSEPSQHYSPDILRSFKLVGMMAMVQIVLGISTLLLQVPVTLGALHQAGGLLLFSAILYNLHSIRSL